MTAAMIEKTWWKEATAYQIYPRSFKDSNGDGIGDLNGVTSKLDYLQDLGIDLIWICPIFASPNDDNGYDISDYQDIMADFGTMEDFDRLLTQAHARDIKVILDLVPNHTSDEHAWFKESRSSRDNPKRDWYIWKDESEINNWESIFKGSIWEYDELTDQYYLHFFSKKQPDLNWENPEVRDAMCSMINWWLEKGIDGFRIDAISVMKKAPGLPDLPNPEGLDYVPSIQAMMNVDGIIDFVDEMCQKTFNKHGAVTVGEANGVNPSSAVDWVGAQHNRLNMIFQFEHLALWQEGENNTLDLVKLKQVFNQWQQGMHGVGWNSLFVENHDIPRVVSKWGDTDKYWYESATAIAAMYFLMQGTPFIYQGQEIGMTNTVFDRVEDFDCVLMKNQAREMQQGGMDDEAIIKALAPHARDNVRTPMQWDNSEFAGFSSVAPWLALNPNYSEINVAAQVTDSTSVHGFYKKLIALRKSRESLIYGDFDLVLPRHERLFAYVRRQHDEGTLILVNFSDEELALTSEEVGVKTRSLLLSNYADQNTTLTLRPFEVKIFTTN